MEVENRPAGSEQVQREPQQPGQSQDPEQQLKIYDGPYLGCFVL